MYQTMSTWHQFPDGRPTSQAAATRADVVALGPHLPASSGMLGRPARGGQAVIAPPRFKGRSSEWRIAYTRSWRFRYDAPADADNQLRKPAGLVFRDKV